MKNFLILLVACPLALSAAEFKIGSHTFTLPEGFEVEQVAGPPLVDRPIEADFDELGRLYVTDSSGSNDKPEKQLQDKPHRIVRLEDTDGDGRFDKSQVFADKMMFPEGCMWFDGSLYVAAPPSIWKLTDTDGDGVADKREEWFQGKTLTGCANDLHGPYLGPDGWIYWCKGAFAKQSYTLPNGKTFNTRAAHIFRARPDGTGIEPVLTGGMDNPVGVAFTPTGERILGGTFFQRPGGGKRDGLIHAVYGGVYGKDHDVVYEHKLTGDLMPIMTHHGPSATASITRYRANVFGPEHQDNIFACLFNLHKITRHVLEPEGATYRTIDSDFLVSNNTDFHPTDVFEDADGSLLVIDTGGWYKLCCPTSQLYKPDVLGAIYRVRKKGAQKIADPRGLQMNWRGMEVTDLARLLGDPRHTVRDRAIHTLAKRGITSVPELIQVLKKSKSVEARRNAVWALTRIPSEAARAGVRRALDDPDESVRHCALHSISAWRDAVYYDTLVEILEQGSPALKRIAAEAIGRIGIVRGRKDPIHHLYNVPLNDRVLEHSQIFALIELGSTRLVNVFAPAETRPPPASPLERRYGTPVGPRDTLPAAHKRAILIAVDQMDHSRLNPEHVIPILTNKDASLKQTAWWVIGHRPQWGGALAEFFKDRLTQPEFSESDAAEMENQLARLAGDRAIQSMMTELLLGSNSPNVRRTLLQAMARTSLKEIPSGWPQAVRANLRQSDQRALEAAVAAARTLANNRTNAPDFSEELGHIARQAGHPAALRIDALAALPNGSKPLPLDLFWFVCAHLEPDQPVTLRSTAAGVLGRVALDDKQLLALTEIIKSAGPLEVPQLLNAFERCSDETVGLKLIAALKYSKGIGGVRPEILKPKLARFPATVRQQAEALMEMLNADIAQQKARLEELAAAVKEGDVRRGQAIFNSAKAACASCHAIGYLGGNLGPDLTRIGQIRNERDLLEAIVFPNASFVRSYEPVVVLTKAGDEFSGVLRKDAPDEVIVATGPGAEARIARPDIVEMRPGNISVMPAGLDEQLNRQELADLLAFLKATRW